MLKSRGDWMPLGSADEQKPAAEGTIEAWGRSPKNPVGGWYGLKKGLRGRFGMYVPPALEILRLAEVEHASISANSRLEEIRELMSDSFIAELAPFASLRTSRRAGTGRRAARRAWCRRRGRTSSRRRG